MSDYVRARDVQMRLYGAEDGGHTSSAVTAHLSGTVFPGEVTVKARHDVLDDGHAFATLMFSKWIVADGDDPSRETEVTVHLPVGSLDDVLLAVQDAIDVRDGNPAPSGCHAPR